ncbi:ubiquinol-cytochrome C chaperone family protein [Brevundimonas sp.]|uniref:ubiquinol-cytochrome C chaperone family protein n=1 Tax=Brevundimonas sp. TaxID=1871086 RepID=UPI0024890016|nr:ubiquinol-cytochrome C chaperone family protein [Brevundimonas sp.]MDI1280778.1 ubiquinol-cytochrome C chaperone family protein [Brevundimonas sp.]
MLKNLLRSRPAAVDGDALYALAVTQARRPDFYTRLGVEDRIDARFELYTLHVLLLVLRLRDDGDRGGEAAQVLFDTYVSALDNTLRELGVGDVSVGKKMRKLGESLYGRMAAYEAPLRAADPDALAAGLARNVYGHDDGAAAAALARYAIASRACLAGQDFTAVVREPEWAEISA